MANCNFKKCIEALNILGIDPKTLNMTVKDRYKKDGKLQGKQITSINNLPTSAIYGVDEWLGFFADKVQKSVSACKVEQAHVKHEHAMIEDTDERMENWEREEKTYTKRLYKHVCLYNFNQPILETVKDYISKNGTYLESKQISNDYTITVNHKLITLYELALLAHIWSSKNNNDDYIFSNKIREYLNRNLYKTEKFLKYKEMILQAV